jgi:hypothetical protein
MTTVAENTITAAQALSNQSIPGGKNIVMPILIKSRVKELMAQKKLGLKEISEAAGLPQVLIWV